MLRLRFARLGRRLIFGPRPLRGSEMERVYRATEERERDEEIARRESEEKE